MCIFACTQHDQFAHSLVYVHVCTHVCIRMCGHNCDTLRVHTRKVKGGAAHAYLSSCLEWTTHAVLFFLFTPVLPCFGLSCFFSCLPSRLLLAFA
mmetsp:Transcript_18153/g.45321  ORF Transcript_18153/g.45321 Transcript_18153/m.45321 type:complete len:95 (-) Transcript_18153:21-305(-)